MENAKQSFLDGQNAMESIMSHLPDKYIDSYVQDCQTKAKNLSIPSAATLRNSQIRYVAQTTRDTRAANGGTVVAPHQAVRAEVELIEAPFILCEQLSTICYHLAEHFERNTASMTQIATSSGTKVFIGHGQSLEWLKLKEFVSDRLGLECDAFTQVPTAGLTTVLRLTTMLDDAAVGLIVMTAEDEAASGEIRARENVVHEAGLFQGRLGFERTIIFVEESCNIFSNIQGLGQLRFPNGQIETKFEELRRTLEREGLLEPQTSKNLSQ